MKQAVEEYKLKLKEAKERPETKAKDDICKTYVPSKKYSSIEELQSDTTCVKHIMMANMIIHHIF